MGRRARKSSWGDEEWAAAALSVAFSILGIFLWCCIGIKRHRLGVDPSDPRTTPAQLIDEWWSSVPDVVGGRETKTTRAKRHQDTMRQRGGVPGAFKVFSNLRR